MTQRWKIELVPSTCDYLTRKYQSSYTLYTVMQKSLKTKSENHLVKLSILFTLFRTNRTSHSMEIGIVIAIVGAIITILGIIFHFQGQSVIGPESSFMYSNPDWITHGLRIAIIGIITTISGIVIQIIK